MLSLKMQFNTTLGFYPKQNLFSFEKYAEVHMHMNGMMYEELGCYIPARTQVDVVSLPRFRLE
jgi:hypothetical protein